MPVTGGIAFSCLGLGYFGNFNTQVKKTENIRLDLFSYIQLATIFLELTSKERYRKRQYLRIQSFVNDCMTEGFLYFALHFKSAKQQKCDVFGYSANHSPC